MRSADRCADVLVCGLSQCHELLRRQRLHRRVSRRSSSVCGAQRVLIAYDRDEAGDRAAEELAKRLTAEGLDCFRIVFPKGMDANEYAR